MASPDARVIRASLDALGVRALAFVPDGPAGVAEHELSELVGYYRRRFATAHAAGLPSGAMLCSDCGMVSDASIEGTTCPFCGCNDEPTTEGPEAA